MRNQIVKSLLPVILICGVLAVSIYACAEKKKAIVDNHLKTAELHEVQAMTQKRTGLQNAINEISNALVEGFVREDNEVNERLRAAHNMVEGDTWDVAGVIHRKGDNTPATTKIPAPMPPAPSKAAKKAGN